MPLLLLGASNQTAGQLQQKGRLASSRRTQDEQRSVRLLAAHLLEHIDDGRTSREGSGLAISLLVLQVQRKIDRIGLLGQGECDTQLFGERLLQIICNPVLLD